MPKPLTTRAPDAGSRVTSSAPRASYSSRSSVSERAALRSRRPFPNSISPVASWSRSSPSATRPWYVSAAVIRMPRGSFATARSPDSGPAQTPAAADACRGNLLGGDELLNKGQAQVRRDRSLLGRNVYAINNILPYRIYIIAGRCGKSRGVERMPAVRATNASVLSWGKEMS